MGATKQEYERLRKENPAKYTRQAIFASILENLVSDFIVYDERLKKDRVMQYGEFENTYFDKEAKAFKNKEELNKIVRLLLR
jgi:hypothetical protein